jgi:ADP-ribose pyrophosphatase YjhB (NUDIX family)
MSPVPEFVVAIREKIGHDPLWLPGVTAVVRRGEEILLVKRSDNGRWAAITGIVDPGEEPAVAAAREALEETGVRIRVERLASTSANGPIVHANGDRASYLDLTFACTWVEGEAHVADDESTEVRWWPVHALPPMGDQMLARIDAALSGEREARFVGAPTPAVEPLRPPRPVLGVDACPAGWVGRVARRCTSRAPSPSSSTWCGSRRRPPWWPSTSPSGSPTPAADAPTPRPGGRWPARRPRCSRH